MKIELKDLNLKELDQQQQINLGGGDCDDGCKIFLASIGVSWLLGAAGFYSGDGWNVGKIPQKSTTAYK